MRRIYSGQAGATLVVTFPKSDEKPSDKLAVHFMDEMKKNVFENTRSYAFPDDMITRAHPKAFAALFTEARAVGVTIVQVNSAWRPSLGSIAHRAGLGLDINYVEDTKEKAEINRASLTHADAKPNNNVSGLEKILFTDYQRAEMAATKNKERIKKLTQDLLNERDPDKQSAIQADLAIVERKRLDKQRAADDARADWDREMRVHEPKLIHSLRKNLSENSSVSQLMDPWYVDVNTHDNIPGTLNEQRKGIEDLHKNHLHISISERKISP